MIREYDNGAALVEENRTFLETDGYRSVFFFADAPLVERTDREHYAVRCTDSGRTLLALKAEPYALLLFGDPECAAEMTAYLTEHGYDMNAFQCSAEIGSAVCDALKNGYGMRAYENLAMEFMKAQRITDPSCEEVTPACDADCGELFELTRRFVSECGLDDPVEMDDIKRTVEDYRVIRTGGKIVSMAKICSSPGKDLRICGVYTRDEYRSAGYARKLVNTVKNEILSRGCEATLNVDIRNPVSSHLYRSIGFVPVFRQGMYKILDLELISLRDRPELLVPAAEWFHSKWKAPEEAYLSCMSDYLSGKTELGWYLCLDGEKIAGGLGVIENDFHDRKDLSPNICAVYTEKEYRLRGIAGALLDMAVEDLRDRGISPVYLVTDHTSFYERYGWEFFCEVKCDGEDGTSRLYIHR